MAAITYTSTDGVKLLGDEVLATLIDDTVETLGIDESVELHTYSNAASITNEANATTGFTQVGLDVGANIFQSQSGTVDDGTYSFEADANDTPTSGARFYVDLSASPLSLVSGNVYKMSFSIRHKGTGDDWDARLSVAHDGGTGSVSVVTVTNTDTTFATYTIFFKYSTDLRYLVIRELNASNNGGVFFDSLTIKRSGELVSNGEMYDELGSSNEWTLGSNWLISGGVATHTAGSIEDLEQSKSLTAGESYVITYEVLTTTAGDITGKFTGTTDVNGTARTANGTYTETLTAVTGNNSLNFTPSSDFDGDIDNISVRLAVPDSSSNADGLEVHGEITKAAVNTNATTVAFSGFASGNYLEQPYSGSLDPGTNSISISFWVKQTAASGTQSIFQRNSSVGAQRYDAYIDSNGILVIRFFDNTTTRQVLSTSSVISSSFNHYVGVYDASNGTAYLYINGVLEATSTGSVLNTLSNSSAVLTVGATPAGGSFATNQSIALLKLFINETLTATQTKTIYNAEKNLFKLGEPHHLVDEQISIDVSMKNDTIRGSDDEKYVIESLDLTKETLFHNTKQTWSMNTKLIPFNSSTETDFFDMKHFLNSVKRGQTFTFDDRGSVASPTEPENVTLDSVNHQATRDANMTDDYTYFMTFKES